MKYLGLSLLIVVTVIFCIWQQSTDQEVKVSTKPQFIISEGIKWKDSYLLSLPKGIDTSIIVKDIHGTPLHFTQYVKPVFNHEAIIYLDRGEWKLHRLTKTAYDSMSTDNFAVARVKRAKAYRTLDTITSWKVKLNDIARSLAKADYVLVLKGERKLIIKRKGVKIIAFDMNLGRIPTGKKEFDSDGKTPEGLYHLDNKFERSDKYYKSFWISYPNAEDRLIAKAKGLKPGVGIMIHGTSPAKRKAKDWTAGCIALQNKDLDTLFAYVDEGTPIEIKK